MRLNKNFILICLLVLMQTVFVNAQEQKVASGPQSQQKGPGVISGVVKDSKTGESIPGVSVVTMGTKEGIATDLDGKFSLKVLNLNDVLSVSFVGYTTQNITMNGNTTFDILLVEDVTKLEEVVVTALNINRTKTSLGYSISTLDGKDLNKAKENNVINSLSGKVAGLQISKSASGVDGSSRVVLRGISSLLGENRPLVVVDGIPVNAGHGGGGMWGGTDGGDGLSDINSEDIESMSILKGAGAAAAYGSRGANGVILITTKKGLNKKGLGVSLTSNYMNDSPMLYPKFQNEYGHGAFGTYPASLPDIGNPWMWSYGPKMEGQMLPNYWGGESAYSPQPNNYKDFFQNGSSLVNSVGLESGNEVSSVRASFTSQNSSGIVPLNDLKRQTIFLRGFTKLKDVIELDAKMTYIHSKSQNRPEVAEGNANPGYMLSVMPRNMVNSELFDHQVDENGQELRWTNDPYTHNPYWELYNTQNKDEKHRLQGVFSSKIHFLPTLNLLLRTGMDLENGGTHQHIAKGSTAAPDKQGSTGNSSGMNLEWNSDFLLSFNPKSEGSIAYNFNLGGNYRYNTWKGLNQSGDHLKIADYYAISNAAKFNTGEWFGEKQVFSLYGLASVSYKKWLFFDFTLRNDWSSTLPVNNNSYMYHSENLSFLFTEALNIESSFLTIGKLRGSLSKVGNDTGPYQTQKYYSVNQSVLPYPTGSFSSEMATYDLEPEITNSWEVGTNLNFMESTFILDLTYYQNRSSNQIMSVPLPPGSGYSTKRMNAAELDNKGFEVQLDVAAVKSDDFSWNIIGTWSKNKSTVVKLYGGIQSIILDELWSCSIEARPGQEYGELYGYDFKRDIFGDKLVNDQGFAIQGDYVKMGNMNPDWMAGLSNSFRYKDFTMSFLVDMRMGGELYSQGRNYRDLFGTSLRSVEGRNEWYATHDPTYGYTTPLPGVEEKGYVEKAINENTGLPNAVPIDPLYRNYNVWASKVSAEDILDGTNVRMREVVLGYSLPKEILSKTPLSDVQLSFVGRNLFFFYNAMDDIDPESGYSSGNTGGGFEHCSIPTTRSVGFNIKVNF
jgi:TonB-linked SusC/RagA family outer membrane protein